MEQPSMIEASCHCGAVRLLIAAAPRSVTDCNCPICRRLGVLWAYCSPAEVEIAASPGATSAYSWGRKSIAFHHCRSCGCTTHWAPLPHRDQGRMGVNARLMDPAVLAAARVRRLDGAVSETYLDEA
jgi:hypothetical protein